MEKLEEGKKEDNMIEGWETKRESEGNKNKWEFREGALVTKRSDKRWNRYQLLTLLSDF